VRLSIKVTGEITVIGALGLGGLVLTGQAQSILMLLLAPQHDFDSLRTAPEPDYAKPINWAALPETEDLADIVPAGVPARTTAPRAEVFFIHPTGYINGDEWNSPMDPNSRTEESTQWMMANQASIFNSCCDVWAPRYRQASVYVYLTDNAETARRALDLAYQDVERAFNEFLQRRDPSLPFIIASHSQGTHHATPLLKKRIAGTELRDQMVAAYIIGGRTRVRDIDAMDDVDTCQSADDLHCVIHWRTYGEGALLENWVAGEDSPLVCTNPLSWTNDGQLVDDQHLSGATLETAAFPAGFWGKDKATGVIFGSQPAPIPRVTWAECRNGALTVADLSSGPMATMLTSSGKNYHLLYYPLFHMNIRENAVKRTIAWHTWNRDSTQPMDSPEH
jgi:hypothetical protein